MNKITLHEVISGVNLYQNSEWWLVATIGTINILKISDFVLL